MTGLTGLGWQIHDHLKKYRPKMFQALKQQGNLKQTMERMQSQAKERMMNLEDSGLQHHEALEIVRDDVLLPSEEDLVEMLKPQLVRHNGSESMHLARLIGGELLRSVSDVSIAVQVGSFFSAPSIPTMAPFLA